MLSFLLQLYLLELSTLQKFAASMDYHIKFADQDFINKKHLDY
jgi:hypothetical protein